MSDQELFARLGVPPGPLAIEGFDVHRFGTSVTVRFAYDPWDEPPGKLFTLQFDRCKKVSWEIFEPAFNTGRVHENADEIGTSLGKEHYESPAVIHAIEIELIIEYDTLTILKSW